MCDIECHILTYMLSVVMFNKFDILSFIMLSVFILCVIIPSVVILNAVLLIMIRVL
jgi:hypothetical protein